ncbi:MAG: hypothetical protein ACTSPY_09595 [Candidatus Helarchaeota archaeon]
MNLVIKQFIKLGAVKFSCGKNSIVVVMIKKVNLNVHINDLDKSVHNRIENFTTKDYVLMSNSTIIKKLKELVDYFPINNEFLEIIKTIDIELENIEQALKGNKRKRKIHEPKIPGKIHFRQKLNDKLRIFVSEHRVNYQSMYEYPLIKVLKKNWNYGKIFSNFCVIELNKKGTRILFELDAVAISSENLFVFEIKNSQINNIQEKLERMISASRILSIWQLKMNNTLKKIYPILYFRELNNKQYEKFNVINYRELLSGKSIDVQSMRYYPLIIGS